MITLGILTTALLILALLTIAAALAGGAGLLLIFGDLIVGIWLIVEIIKLICKKAK